METVDRFPNIPLQKEDQNPAIQLFGRRFYKDQTEYEYLIEFLLLFISDKRIDHQNIPGMDNHQEWQGFPSPDLLQYLSQSDKPLEYYPPLRIILKLFAFLGSSRLETRHPCHKTRFEYITTQLKKRITSITDKEDVLELIQQMMIGFEGIAQNRTWCTLVFLPLASRLIAGEIIWKKSKGAQNPDLSWETDLFGSDRFFTFSNHAFMARGGEVLYLQFCNLFSMAASEEIRELEKQLQHPSGAALNLCDQIETGLKNYFQSAPAPAIDDLTNWIEAADLWTLEETEGADNRRRATCGWCPRESWQEAYLFAYEMANICNAVIDPVEKIETLKLCCVFQVLRSLCAQAARYWKAMQTDGSMQYGGVCGFTWLVTSPDLNDAALKITARRNLGRIQEMIHGALRDDWITSKNDSYKLGDEQGQELFVKLGKKLGFIAPWKGPGARFVCDNDLLRFFVLALIRPGQRMTYTSFQEVLFRHYGVAINGHWLKCAIRWTYPKQNIRGYASDNDWLEERLGATGFLISLSDSISLVRNPFSREKDND